MRRLILSLIRSSDKAANVPKPTSGGITSSKSGLPLAPRGRESSPTCHAAEQRDKRASSHHSITSSVRARGSTSRRQTSQSPPQPRQLCRQAAKSLWPAPPGPINGARQVCRLRPFERTSWEPPSKRRSFYTSDIVGRASKESSCVNIRGSSFVEVCQGSADRGGGARPVPHRPEAGVDDLRLHGRDAAPRRASSHTRS